MTPLTREAATLASATRDIHVLLIDDQPIVREGLKAILSHADGFAVVGELSGHSDITETVQAVVQLSPDVVVMDVRRPDVDGVAMCREITSQLPDTRVLLLTALIDDDTLIEAVAAGAAGYLQTSAGPTAVLATIQEVAHGGWILPTPLVRRVFAEWHAPAERSADALTARERDILTQFAQGRSYAEIAADSGRSPWTIRNTVYRIRDKLGCPTQQAAIVWAVRHGLLDAVANGDHGQRGQRQRIDNL